VGDVMWVGGECDMTQLKVRHDVLKDKLLTNYMCADNRLGGA